MFAVLFFPMRPVQKSKARAMSLIPQIGLFEMLLLAALALIIVGPKDLPRLMRGIGGLLRQVRGMADEFRSGLDQMAKEAELEDLQKEIEALKKLNPADEVKQAVDEAMMPLQQPIKAKAEKEGALSTASQATKSEDQA